MPKLDRTDRIDLPAPDAADAPAGVPTRVGGRPTLMDSGYPNRFGYDEFMRLVDELNTEALIVVRLLNVLREGADLEQSAMEAAGLVAYLNAEVGAELPEGMPDWPGLRAANGHPEPHGVPVFQVGNETWFGAEEALRKREEETGESPADFYARCLVAYGEAMHAVDPSIELICDARFRESWWGDPADEPLDEKESWAVLTDPAVREHYRHVTTHAYQPWEVKRLRVDGEEVERSEVDAALDDEAAYHALAGIPNDAAPRRVDGRWTPAETRMMRTEQRLAEATGHRLAFTEWNWNGWGSHMPGGSRPGSRVFAASRATGAANYLHGILRAGHVASIATQSMMLANHWLIGSVRMQETPNSGGEKVPVVMPAGRATSLYAQHHGDRRLAADRAVDPEEIRQDVRVGNVRVMDPLPLLDVVVTADDGFYYVHAIHRRWDGPRVLEVELPGDAAATGVRHEVVPVDGGDGSYASERREVGVADASRLTLPPASVSVTKVARER